MRLELPGFVIRQVRETQHELEVILGQALKPRIIIGRRRLRYDFGVGERLSGLHTDRRVGKLGSTWELGPQVNAYYVGDGEIVSTLFRLLQEPPERSEPRRLFNNSLQRLYRDGKVDNEILSPEGYATVLRGGVGGHDVLVFADTHYAHDFIPRGRRFSTANVFQPVFAEPAEAGHYE